MGDHILMLEGFHKLLQQVMKVEREELKRKGEEEKEERERDCVRVYVCVQHTKGR